MSSAVLTTPEMEGDDPFGSFDPSLRLFPSSSLRACDGFDLTHKSVRAVKDDIVMVLPFHIAVQGSENQQGILGYLDLEDAANPVFILETNDGSYNFKGRYVSTVSTILPVYAQPKKKEMSCSKTINQFLVFDEPNFIPSTNTNTSTNDDFLSQISEADSPIANAIATPSSDKGAPSYIYMLGQGDHSESVQGLANANSSAKKSKADSSNSSSIKAALSAKTPLDISISELHSSSVTKSSSKAASAAKSKKKASSSKKAVRMDDDDDDDDDGETSHDGDSDASSPVVVDLLDSPDPVVKRPKRAASTKVKSFEESDDDNDEEENDEDDDDIDDNDFDDNDDDNSDEEEYDDESPKKGKQTKATPKSKSINKTISKTKTAPTSAAAKKSVKPAKSNQKGEKKTAVTSSVTKKSSAPKRKKFDMSSEEEEEEEEEEEYDDDDDEDEPENEENVDDDDESYGDSPKNSKTKPRSASKPPAPRKKSKVTYIELSSGDDDDL